MAGRRIGGRFTTRSFSVLDVHFFTLFKSEGSGIVDRREDGE